MFTKHAWLKEFCKELIAANIISQDILQHSPNVMNAINSLPLLHIDAQQWAPTLCKAAQRQWRFVAIWAQDLRANFQIDICLEFSGVHVLLRTTITSAAPQIASATNYYSAANRLERHIYDMFGVVFIDSPDQRRWTRHQAWTRNQFPLRKNFVALPLQQTATPPDLHYPFIVAHGVGICEVPVGPVHAGIIEPGHFRFQIAGEDMLNLEEHLGYVHKGIEKIAEGRDFAGLIKLAGRVSGDSTVAYAWATCMACENAYAVIVPARAAFLRAIMCERERVANHLGDFAAICNDVGFAFAYYQFMRLKETWLRLNAEIFGHRFMMDCIKVGGVTCDLAGAHKTLLEQQLTTLRQELDELYPMVEDNSSLHDRLKNTGILSRRTAQKLGVLGYVGRASGDTFDLRRAAPYAPYEQLTKLHVPIYKTGDVLARTRIRAQEILATLELLHELLEKIPEGEISVDVAAMQEMREAGARTNTNVDESINANISAQKNIEGIGLVEGWRGEILVYVSFDAINLVERFFPRDPSWFSWLALEQLIHGNIVPDFPVCNKSINGSYSGVDL